MNLEQFLTIAKRNKIVGCYLGIPAKKNRVNLFQYHPELLGPVERLHNKSSYNLGDSLGEVIVKYMLGRRGIDVDSPVKKTRFLNTVGSNILGSYQDCTIWGSGLLSQLPTERTWSLNKIIGRKLDIRAVRGPLTREALLSHGYKCPEVYGDPAILMPMIYSPQIEIKRDYVVILQFAHEVIFRKNHPDLYMVSMNTDDYKSVIDEIVSSKMVYTSSLHGIILAESYGIPAVFFRGLSKNMDFKYCDYYYSTGRMEFPIANTFEEALKIHPCPLPELSHLQQGLMKTFPYDLWEC